MPVKTDASGRRSVEVEIEVPGTPEQVWEAIASGPGVSSWFVPCEFDQRAGGTIRCEFGPGFTSSATITEWDPPKRIAATSQDMGPETPALATEWIVEARSGGTCVVRVVHSLFADSADWDDQLTGAESGWPTYFQILRLYLEHFVGKPCSQFGLLGMTSDSIGPVWNTLATSLELPSGKQGTTWRAPIGDKPFAGEVALMREAEHARAMLVLLDEPTGGIAKIGAHAMGPMVCVSVNFYLYGDALDDTLTANRTAWNEWITSAFPLPH